MTSKQEDNLKSKIWTSSWGGVRKLPYAFTEQGIYMLMTVLLDRDLATLYGVETTSSKSQIVILNTSGNRRGYNVKKCHLPLQSKG